MTSGGGLLAGLRVLDLSVWRPGPYATQLLGDQLDLMPLARDAVLLHLPLAPLCRDDCAGLCPSCGNDLNQSTCDCDMTIPDPRWDRGASSTG